MQLKFVKKSPMLLSSLASLAAKTICCLALGAMSIQTGNATPSVPPIQAVVTVEGNTNLSVGQPLSLLYTITNVSSDQNIGIGLGTDKAQWCQLSLTDANGQTDQTIPNDGSLEPRGLHFTGTYLLQPDASEQDHLVVTRYLQITHPGKYTLTVQVRLPYTLEEPSSSVSLADRVKSSNTFLTKRFVFPLTVVAANTTDLVAKAAALSRMARAEKNGSKLKFLLDQLFSMPPKQAAPAWKELALGASPGDTDLIVRKLADLRSSEAADILFQMIGNPAASSNFVSDKLAEVYNSGTPALRAHIQTLAGKHGIQLPEQISLPQVVD